MIYTILISAILLAAGVLLLGIRIFFVKDGKFPNIHIGGSKAMRDRGIHCATTQHIQAQKSKRMKFENMISELKENY